MPEASQAACATHTQELHCFLMVLILDFLYYIQAPKIKQVEGYLLMWYEVFQS